MRPHPPSLYNLACCLSRLASLEQPEAEAAATPPGSVLHLPKEQCLSAAIAWLRAATAAGWTDAEHMKSDVDLSAVRELRAVFFATAVQMAEATAAGI